MKYRSMAYTLLCLAMFFYFILGNGLILNQNGELDRVSLRLLFSGISLLAMLAHHTVAALAITASTAFILSINAGAKLYLQLYQSYVPSSITSLRGEALTFISGLPTDLIFYSIAGSFVLLIGLYFVLSKQPKYPPVATTLVVITLISTSLYIQTIHDQRDNKDFSKNNESPVGFFIRSADLVPLIDGSPLVARYAKVESYAIAAKYNKRLDDELIDSIHRYYPDNQNESLYPLYRERPQYPVAKLPEAPQNIILIVLESVRDSESNKHASLESATPFIDSLKQESLYFENNYATAALTAKSETAILCGVLDYLGGLTTSVRETDIKASCLPELLAKNGYERYWFHGNDIEFYNRKYFLPEVGFNKIRGIEHYYGRDINETDITDNTKPILGWGIPDHNLFDYAFEELSQETKPFFAEILTVSNHLPFDWDWGIDFPEHLKKRPDDKMYDAYRRGIYYTDKALQGFVSKFRNSKLYDNTLLVITGDHGVWTYGDDTTSEINKFNQFFQVPLLFYGKSIEPRLVTTPSSHLDIAPTILDMIGSNLSTAFLGSSLIKDANQPPQKPIFMAMESSYAFRQGNTMCIPEGQCSSNGLDECPDWQAKSKKRVTHLCYNMSDNDIFANDRLRINPDDVAFEHVDNLFNYALVGLEIGFVPDEQTAAQRSSAKEEKSLASR
jgi:phosphoglycerol transferase MdoB-like AlkP superfamily enzyme